MTLLQIRYVLVIAEAGSMNKAAEMLYVTQPTLTSALRDLEQELGITIFYRSKRGIRLSGDGVEFLQYARRVYEQYELLEEHYHHSGGIKQKFGVSAQHYSFVDKAFVETVKRFGAEKYDFAIRETKTFRVIQNVALAHSEFGILYRSEENRAYLNALFRKYELEFHHLIDCQAFVYLWKGHPLAGESAISLRQLSRFPCLVFEQGSQSSLFLSEEILSSLEYPQIIHANDRATMLNLMVGLNGYTLCSGLICEELNGSDYAAIPFQEDDENKNSVMEIGYICRKSTSPTAVGRIFLEEIEKYLEKVKKQQQAPEDHPNGRK